MASRQMLPFSHRLALTGTACDKRPRGRQHLMPCHTASSLNQLLYGLICVHQLPQLDHLSCTLCCAAQMSSRLQNCAFSIPARPVGKSHSTARKHRQVSRFKKAGEDEGRTSPALPVAALSAFCPPAFPACLHLLVRLCFLYEGKLRTRHAQAGLGRRRQNTIVAVCD